MLAVVGFEVGFLVAARTTTILSLAFGLVNHGGRHDTGGHSDDGVTENHDEGGEKASNDRDRSDVAITDGGEGDNRPVYAGSDVGELSARLCSLNHKHQRSHNGDKDEHKEEIDEYLPDTELDALKQQMAFVDKGEELEHAEDADKSEHPEDEEVACRGKVRNEGEIEG